ncbi:reverse transcriptase domain-containing protein [Tanacetum coccineum]|uniref:Reverse transcriptase domain-containing protein n=1 Tax=Tanacetum coccineum TaxID=301880 RepID=A0ABQ4WIS0_9ASTR
MGVNLEEITEKCLPSLLKLQYLEDLALEGCCGINDESLITLRQGWKSLKTLNISHSENVTHVGVSSLTSNTGCLQNLNLAYGPLVYTSFLLFLLLRSITNISTWTGSVFNMSHDRSRSPGLAKRFCNKDRASYRDAPYKRDRPTYRSSSDSDIPIITTTTIGRPFKGPLSTYEVGEPSSAASALGMGTRTTEIAKAHKEAFRARRCLDKFIWEMSFVIEWDIPELMNGSIATGDRLTLLEQDQIKNQEEIQCLKNQVHSTNISATLAAMDRDRREKNQDQDGK